MVEVKYLGRLGNQLFTYATARVIAEHLGYQLRAPAIAGFPGTTASVSGQAHEQPQQLILRDQFFSMPDLLRDPRPRKIFIQAYCQNYAYFASQANAVKHWYQQPAPETPPDPDAVVCHLRLTDFVDRYHWGISLDYYRTALETLYRDRPVILVTDDPEHACLADFVACGAEVHRGSMLEQFRFLVAARQLLIGTSTFAWWAAFLSTGRVVAPLLARGYYFRPEYKNEHYVVDEDRYTYVAGVKMFHE